MMATMGGAERGPTGDHGQDGRIGPRGERGLQGEPGTMTPHDKARMKQTDQRMLILYLVGIVLLVWISITQVRSNADRHHFEHAVIANCHLNRANTENFNQFIDTLIATTNTSRVLTDAEKRQRAEFFMAAKGTVPDCPPG